MPSSILVSSLLLESFNGRHYLVPIKEGNNFVCTQVAVEGRLREGWGFCSLSFHFLEHCMAPSVWTADAVSDNFFILSGCNMKGVVRITKMIQPRPTSQADYNILEHAFSTSVIQPPIGKHWWLAGWGKDRTTVLMLCLKYKCTDVKSTYEVYR